MTVDGLAEQFAVVDRRCTAHISATGGHAQRATIVVHWRAPDLATATDVDGEGPVAVHHIHHAVIDGGLRQLAHVVGETEGPERHQTLDVRLVDLLERTEHLQVVTGAEQGYVFRVLALIEQFIRRLRLHRRAASHQQQCEYFFHVSPLVNNLIIRATTRTSTPHHLPARSAPPCGRVNRRPAPTAQ